MTNINKILTILKNEGINISEKNLNMIFKKFQKQLLDVDYFLHKNIVEFLQDQFDEWYLKNIVKNKEIQNDIKITIYQHLKNIVYKITEYVSFIENKILEVWN